MTQRTSVPSPVSSRLAKIQSQTTHWLKKLLRPAAALALWVALSGTAQALDVAGSLVFDLHYARGLALSGTTVTNWTNSGTASGAFISANGNPSLATVDGFPVVRFSGGQRLVTPYLAPSQIVGQSGGLGKPFSVEYWVKGNNISGERTVICWGNRDTTCAWAAQIGYGDSTCCGATVHWCNDMNWGSPVPVVGQWHHLVVTYDGTTERVYADGVTTPKNTVARSLNIRADSYVILGAAGTGTPAPPPAGGFGNYFDGWIGAVRVHAGTLTPTQIANNYAVGLSAGAGLPVAINASAPTSVGSTNATLNGYLAEATADTTVTIYYGFTDQGTNKGLWGGSVDLGTKMVGSAFLATVTNLLGNKDYYYRSYGSNANGDGWSLPVTFRTPMAAVVVADAASGIWTNTATLNGRLLGESNNPTAITICYGTSDQGTNSKTAWAVNAPLGNIPVGSFSTTPTTLVPGTLYYYRCYGTNAFGDGWSGVQSFSTPGLPTVTNKAMQAATTVYAYLKGQLVSTNYLSTTVRLYWGTNDGGTTIGKWTNVVNLGVQGVGELATKISGLSAATTYYYRFYATNNAGDSWAPSTASFTTPGLFDTSGYVNSVLVTVSGYTNRSQTLAAFPALVTLSSNIANFSYYQFLSADGADLRFMEASGSELAYDVETWDTNGTSLVWAKVPELTNGTVITAYWGKAGVAAPSNRASTWSDSYAAVWHMTNALSTNMTGNTAFDLKASFGTVTPGPGVIGTGLGFPGNAGLNAGDVDLPSTGFTIAFWAWITNTSGDQWNIGKNNGNYNLMNRYGNWEFNLNTWNYNNNGWGNFASEAAVWVYVAGTYDGVNLRLYKNGVLMATKASTGMTQNNDQTTIGRNINGRLDEVRLSTVARSADWLWARYQMEKPGSTFLTYGGVATLTLPISVTNRTVTQLTESSATIRGSLLSAGPGKLSSPARVYWGTNDGSSVFGNWSNVVDLGTVSVGDISVGLSNLTANTAYYYAFYATNETGEAWGAPSASFATLPPPAHSLLAVMTGYTNSETLTNFPVLVKLNASVAGFSYSDFLSPPNSDLWFKDLAGNMLNFEIDTWNASGDSLLWVQVPKLTNGTAIRMLWGQAGASPAAYRTNGSVWADGHTGVWHMSQPTLTDATGHGYNSGAPPGTVYSTNGVLGTAQYYAGAGGTSVGSLRLSNQTLSAWVWLTTASRDESFMSRGADMWFWHQGTSLRFETVPWGGDTTYPNPATGVWIQFTVTSTSDGQQAIFVNGSRYANWTKTGPNPGTGNFYIGGEGGRQLLGNLDECRAEQVVRSAAWIQARYLMEKPASTFLSLLPTSPLAVTNLVPASVLSRSAQLRGSVLGLGGEFTTTTRVYYGTNDGGTTIGSWSNVVDFGARGLGDVATTVSGLAPETTHYFRFYVTNASGEAWANASTSFLTLPIVPPTVTNLPASGVTDNSASLNGQLVSAGTQPTVTVRVYYGTNDGGTVSGNWSNVVGLGSSPAGALSTLVNSLTPNTTYYYRFYATGLDGDDWADEAETFTTRPPYWAAFNYWMDITFTGYASNETLMDFPAMVKLNATGGFDYGQLGSAEAADLRFRWPDGSELSYELDTLDTFGNSYFWVKLPVLTNGTTIRAHWGQTGMTAPSYRTNGATWNSSYVGVWHMNQALVQDSTTNRWNAVSAPGPSVVSAVSAMVGGGQHYNGSAGNPCTVIGDIKLTNCTLSGWVKVDNGNWESTFMARDGDMWFYDQGDHYRYETAPWGGDNVVMVGDVSGVGRWVHMVATSEPDPGVPANAIQKLYIDGQQLVAAWSKTMPNWTSGNMFTIAAAPSGWRPMLGSLDELRAERAPRSPAWVWASYENQKNPDTFMTKSAVTYQGPPQIVVILPTVTDISSTTATLGATISQDGGSAVESYGTVWDTTVNPTANSEAIAGSPGTPPVAFTQPRTGLSPGTAYFFRGWASNAASGIKFSGNGQFVTPPNSASGVVFSSVTNVAMTVGWTPPTPCDGVVVIMKQASAVTAVPVDGVSYTGNSGFGAGTDLGTGEYVVYAGSGSSATVNGLVPGQTYYVAVYPFAGSGVLRNYQELTPATGNQTTGNGLGSVAIAGSLLIDLNISRGLVTNETGLVTTWTNVGTLGGQFVADGDQSTWPPVVNTAGLPCLSFDGIDQGDHLRASFAAPASMTGTAPNFSVEMWMNNPSIEDVEWTFGWARGWTCLRHAGLGYGSNPWYGAVAHWCDPDMGFDGGVPAANAWHHIVVTMDSATMTEKIYVDGVLNAQELKSGGAALDIWPGDPVTLGNTLDGNLNYRAWEGYAGYINMLRVHSAALTPEQVANNYQVGPRTIITAVQIVTQPANRTVGECGSATFTVEAVGESPITYQWYRAPGTLIPGAESASYTLSGAGLADDGAQFYCVASNNIGGTAYTATSQSATLTVAGVAANFAHWYPIYDGDVFDYAGGAHGTIYGTPSFVNNDAIVFDGTPGNYVDFGTDALAGFNQVTFEFWAAFGINGDWSRVFDFGDTTGVVGQNYIMFTPHSGMGTHRFEIVTSAGSALVDVPGVLDGRTLHVACVYDPANGYMAIYTNGVLDAWTVTTVPLASVVNVYSWMGRSLFSADAYLTGQVEEFRIYSSALSADKVRQSFLRGKDVPPDAGLNALIVGQVQLEEFVGGSRTVTFSYTDGSTYTNQTDQVLAFANGVASYALPVPAGTQRVSAKTAWNLRKTLPAVTTSCGPAVVANFTGAKLLPGGDLNGSNLVAIEDYFQLAAAWYQTDPAADIDGNGLVDLDDYFILANRWYLEGDLE